METTKSFANYLLVSAYGKGILCLLCKESMRLGIPIKFNLGIPIVDLGAFPLAILLSTLINLI